MNENNVVREAPHGAIIQIYWEVHEQLPDGKYKGQTMDSGKLVFDIKGNDRALTLFKLNNLLNLIKEEVKNVSELEVNGERFREREIEIQGVEKPRRNDPDMFSMRGTIGNNNNRR